MKCPICHGEIHVVTFNQIDILKCESCSYFQIPTKDCTKPPLGTKPCRIHAEQRIEDLSNAILRNIGSDNPKYDLIRKWATEIVLQCDLAEIVDGGN